MTPDTAIFIATDGSWDPEVAGWSAGLWAHGTGYPLRVRITGGLPGAPLTEAELRPIVEMLEFMAGAPEVMSRCLMPAAGVDEVVCVTDSGWVAGQSLLLADGKCPRHEREYWVRLGAAIRDLRSSCGLGVRIVHRPRNSLHMQRDADHWAGRSRLWVRESGTPLRTVSWWTRSGERINIE